MGGDLALNPVKNLSGGQTSRLDLETIEGLAMALNKFEGGVVLVSHDDRLVQMVADELWVVMPGKTRDVPGTVTVFEGSFDEYKQMLRDEFERANMTTGGRIKRKN